MSLNVKFLQVTPANQRLTPFLLLNLIHPAVLNLRFNQQEMLLFQFAVTQTYATKSVSSISKLWPDICFLCMFFMHEIHMYASSNYYCSIAFDERVTFWLQSVQSLPCVCADVTLFVRRAYVPLHKPTCVQCSKYTHTRQIIFLWKK